jgi:hypothetical protein
MSSTMAEGGEEHLEGHRRLVAQQGQDPKGEGYVGGHRDPPARRALRASVDGEVDQRRHQGPAQSRGDGQRRVARRGQLAHEHLALDLEADYKEENRHEPVVDPVGEVLGDRKVAYAYGQLRVPQRGIARAPRGVGPHEGHRGGDDQEDAA